MIQVGETSTSFPHLYHIYFPFPFYLLMPYLSNNWRCVRPVVTAGIFITGFCFHFTNILLQQLKTGTNLLSLFMPILSENKSKDGFNTKRGLKPLPKLKY